MADAPKRGAGGAKGALAQRRPFSRRQFALAAGILCTSGSMVIVYLQVVATAVAEVAWAWSMITFIATLVTGSAGNLLSIKGYAKGRVLLTASYVSFYATSSLVVAVTAYRFEGPEAALFTGAVWFSLLIFLAAREAVCRIQ